MGELRVKEYKRKFDGHLRHVKAILMVYKRYLPKEDWQKLVDQTILCIHQYPEDFFGADVPDQRILKQAIDAVFHGFLTDIHVREVQRLKKYQ
jgi:hypothetical protein